MGDLLHTTVTHFVTDPVETFGLFGTERGGGWILGSRVSSARVGALLETGLPVSVLPDDVSRGTARVTEITPYTRIVLEHESPWSGTTVLSFSPHGSGTRVRTTSTLTGEAIGWINQQLDMPSEDEGADDDVVVGLITDLSGQTSVFGRSIVNCARLAVAEINEDGGIAGRTLRLAHVDDSTDPDKAQSALAYLTQEHNVAAIVGAHTSRTLEALAPRLLRDHQLYLFAPVNEGGVRQGNIFRLGESSADQLRATLPRLGDSLGARSWYLLGNDYSWPRKINSVARGILSARGWRVAGERYLAMGRLQGVDDLLTDIERSGADVVLSSLVGYASIEFERAFAAAGLRDRIATFSALLDENTVEHLGSAGDGIWSAMSYFNELDSTANRSFVERYRRGFGALSAPPSALSVSVYESLHLWARAARRSEDLHADAVAAQLHGLAFDGPRGTIRVRADGTAGFDYYLAQADAQSLRVAESFGR